MVYVCKEALLPPLRYKQLRPALGALYPRLLLLLLLLLLVLLLLLLLLLQEQQTQQCEDCCLLLWVSVQLQQSEVERQSINSAARA